MVAMTAVLFGARGCTIIVAMCTFTALLAGLRRWPFLLVGVVVVVAAAGVVAAVVVAVAVV